MYVNGTRSFSPRWVQGCKCVDARDRQLHLWSIIHHTAQDDWYIRQLQFKRCETALIAAVSSANLLRAQLKPLSDGGKVGSTRFTLRLSRCLGKPVNSQKIPNRPARLQLPARCLEAIPRSQILSRSCFAR